MVGALKNNQPKSRAGGARPGAGRKKGSPNKATRELREIARDYTEDALGTLAIVMRDSESDAARVSAANSLLDRGYGKPSQAVELTGRDGKPIETITTDMTPVQAAEAYQRMIAG